MKVNLTEQVALVTGAARGIGQAIADALAANGARVVYADIDEAAAKQAAARAKGGIAIRMDVSQLSEVEAGVDRVLRDFGRLDICVNNAGINTIKHRVNISEFPQDEWERIVNVDLTGLFLVSRAVAKPMIASKSGRIINIASVLGVVPARLQCAFVAAKAGVVNLTRAMALELGPHRVLVNCIAPGSTLTDGTRQLFYSDDAVMKERTASLLAHIPLGRAATVEEVAHGALFFAAPESSYITGQVLCVDGGWSAGGFMRDF